MRPKLYLQRLENFNIAQKCRTQIGTHPFPKRSKRVCFIVTRRSLGQSPTHENSALLECCSALQKCQIGLMAPDTLSCLDAVWTHFLWFFGWSLYLDMFSSFVYDFFISFLDNSGYLRIIILKINTLKQILIKFKLSTILLLSNHPFYSYACNPILNTNYQPITKSFN